MDKTQNDKNQTDSNQSGESKKNKTTSAGASFKEQAQKLILPTVVLIIGLSLSTGAYFFLINKNKNTSTEVNIESFQAPAELSAEIQAECQSQVLSIDKTKNCDQKKDIFVKAVQNCTNYSYFLEQPVALPAEGLFTDIIFNILQCYRRDDVQKTESTDQSVMGLLKLSKNFEPWDSQFFGMSCNSSESIKAYEEVYTLQEQFKCFSEDKMSDILSELKNKNFDYIKNFISKDRVPVVGLLDSNLVCPVTGDQIVKNLESALGDLSAIEMNKGENSTEENNWYIEFLKNDVQIGLITFSKNLAANCLFLKSISLSQLETSEY